MDTDSNYFGITAENVEDLIKPELSEEFVGNKHNWFVTPLASKGKCTPGCMIKISQGSGVVTPSKPLPPTPCFKMFLERSLNDPHPSTPHFKHISLLSPSHPPPLPP